MVSLEEFDEAVWEKLGRNFKHYDGRPTAGTHLAGRDSDVAEKE
jgi:hypothetical protein